MVVYCSFNARTWVWIFFEDLSLVKGFKPFGWFDLDKINMQPLSFYFNPITTE